jgi:hypothetical protein
MQGLSTWLTPRQGTESGEPFTREERGLYRNKRKARTTKLNCAKSKSGDKLSQAGKLTGLTISELKEKLWQVTGLTPEKLRIMLNMKQEGCSLEQTREEFRVELEVLKQFLTGPENIQDTVVGYRNSDRLTG